MIENNKTSKAHTLTSLLKRINRGDDPEMLRREACRLLSNVEPKDIARAEQNLINDGYSSQLVQLLCATFMLIALPAEQTDDMADQLPGNHLLRLILVEHDLFRFFLADLSDVVESIRHSEYLSDTCEHFRKLAHIVKHLSALCEHFEREDDVIFPYLVKYGRISLCQAMQGDHINIRTEIDKLVDLTVSFGSVSLEEFKNRLVTITRSLFPTLSEHLSQEDAIVYPIALGVINDAELWRKIKTVCDEIDYCGICL